MKGRLRLTAILAVALGLAGGLARPQEPAEQETDIPGVTARLLHATRQDRVLTLAILLCESTLNNPLALVDSRPAAQVAIEGHTDVGGEAGCNQARSGRWAAAVRVWLVEHGVGPARIGASGAGESRPIRAGMAEADHRAKRRVEVWIRG